MVSVKLNREKPDAQQHDLFAICFNIFKMFLITVYSITVAITIYLIVIDQRWAQLITNAVNLVSLVVATLVVIKELYRCMIVLIVYLITFQIAQLFRVELDLIQNSVGIIYLTFNLVLIITTIMFVGLMRRKAQLNNCVTISDFNSNLAHKLRTSFDETYHV